MLINDLSFLLPVLYVHVSYVPCLLSFIIYVCMMFCFYNWPSGCRLGTLINMD